MRHVNTGLARTMAAIMMITPLGFPAAESVVAGETTALCLEHPDLEECENQVIVPQRFQSQSETSSASSPGGIK